MSAAVFLQLPLGGLGLPVRTAGLRGEAPFGHLLAPGSVAVLHPFDDGPFYRHGWNSWSPSGWRPLSGDNKEAAKQINAILKPKQWIKLINRLGTISNPTVRRTPSKFATKVPAGPNARRGD